MMTKMKRTFAGSAEILVMQTIRFGIRVPVAEVSNLFTRIVSFSGLITATLVNARFASILFHSPQYMLTMLRQGSLSRSL
jgi:hypothetical protein